MKSKLQEWTVSAIVDIKAASPQEAINKARRIIGATKHRLFYYQARLSEAQVRAELRKRGVQ